MAMKKKAKTQSERLYQLLTSKEKVTQDQMTKKLKVDYAGPYISELRAAGADINYNWKDKYYTLNNRVKLPEPKRRGRPANVEKGRAAAH